MPRFKQAKGVIDKPIPHTHLFLFTESIVSGKHQEKSRLSMFGFMRLFKRVFIVILCSLIFTGCKDDVSMDDAAREAEADEEDRSFWRYWILLNVPDNEDDYNDDNIKIVSKITIGVDTEIALRIYQEEWSVLGKSKLKLSTEPDSQNIISYVTDNSGKMTVKGLKPGTVNLRHQSRHGDYYWITITVVDKTSFVDSDNNKISDLVMRVGDTTKLRVLKDAADGNNQNTHEKIDSVVVGQNDIIDYTFDQDGAIIIEAENAGEVELFANDAKVTIRVYGNQFTENGSYTGIDNLDLFVDSTMELRLYNTYEKQYEDIEIQTSPQQNSITSHEIENGILTIKAVKAGTVTLYGTKGAVVKVMCVTEPASSSAILLRYKIRLHITIQVHSQQINFSTNN